MRKFSEFNNSGNEFNKLSQEFVTYNEFNTNLKPTQAKPKNNKLFRNFMFMCASVAVLPLGIYVPMFSEIFSHQISATQTLICEIAHLEAEWDRVSCSIKLDNIETSNYWACVVERDKATEEFVANVADSVKDSLKTAVVSGEHVYSFEKCLTQSGKKYLKPASNYAILLINDDKIVRKGTFVTEKLKPVLSVNFADPPEIVGDYKYVKIQPTMNPKFKDYVFLYLQVIDSLNIEVCHANFTESNISTSWLQAGVKSSAPEAKYKFNVYCSTEHPEKFEDFENFVESGTKYFLIYTDEIVF